MQEKEILWAQGIRQWCLNLIAKKALSKQNLIALSMERIAAPQKLSGVRMSA